MYSFVECLFYCEIHLVAKMYKYIEAFHIATISVYTDDGVNLEKWSLSAGVSILVAFNWAAFAKSLIGRETDGSR